MKFITLITLFIMVFILATTYFETATSNESPIINNKKVYTIKAKEDIPLDTPENLKLKAPNQENKTKEYLMLGQNEDEEGYISIDENLNGEGSIWVWDSLEQAYTTIRFNIKQGFISSNLLEIDPQSRIGGADDNFCMLVLIESIKTISRCFMSEEKIKYQQQIIAENHREIIDAAIENGEFYPTEAPTEIGFNFE